MGLHKFNIKKELRKLNFKKNKAKYIKIGTICISILVVIVSIIYFTYSIFTLTDMFKTTELTVDTFVSSDYVLDFYIEGESVLDVPTNTYEGVVTCENGAIGRWNKKTSSVTVNTTEKTKCRVTLATPPVEPELYNGLIPIKYDESNNIVIADTTAEWYNYLNHEWANAILIDQSNSTIKNKYINEDGSFKSGTVVDIDDVLQMYVWIPRYRYQLFNVEDSYSDEQMINIEFESKDTAKSNGSQNGEWLTHPAFTFGTTELNGIWVGKFESSGTMSDVKIIPNVSSLRYENVSTMFNASRAIESNQKYGLDSNTIDTHLMKNMEWGAVAYLTNSKYGRYESNGSCISSGCEVWINSSEDYITGCTGSSVMTSDTTTCHQWDILKKEYYVKDSGENNQTMNPTITNDTTYPWSLTNGVYKSTTQGVQSSTTNLVFNFILPQVGELSFDWSVSSESVSYDYIYYTITKDGNILDDTGISTKIGGTSYGTDESTLTYKSTSKVLEPGTYTITFTYIKDGSTDRGIDAGYVKNLSVRYGATYTKKEEYTKNGGIGASTTGTIYGIYDMSGGAYEYVMGNMVDETGAFYPGDSGFTTAPESKYYDSYAYSTSSSADSRGYLGDATKETDYWNDDSRSLAYFYESSSNPENNQAYPWFRRGGYYSSTSSAGIFAFYYATGASSNISFRIVLSAE